MDVREEFVVISGLICEPVRAKMLWSLLDGRAYTAGELAYEAGVSSTSASNHLSKLLQGELVKVVSQGRHRYYSISRPDVAYAIESLANLTGGFLNKKSNVPKKGIKYCRTCYDHLAGYLGVGLADAMLGKGFMEDVEGNFTITSKGWEWAKCMGMDYQEFSNKRRPVVRKCLDWSERKPHAAGQFGAKLLSKMLEKRWLLRVHHSRELILTGEGQRKLNDLLDMRL